MAMSLNDELVLDIWFFKGDFKLLSIPPHTGNWQGALQLAQVAHEVAAESIWVRQVACK